MAAPQTVSELSNAAQWLVDDAIAKGCGDAGGRFDTSGVFVRDLDGDNRDDLILSHEGIQCSRPGRMQNNFCGAQVCLGIIYLRRGQLLEDVADFQGSVEGVGSGSRPIITIVGHGGGRVQARWNGSQFQAQ